MVLFAATASATPDLGQIVNLPVFDGIEHSGMHYSQLVGDTETACAKLLVEFAGFSETNKFGIYDPSNPNAKLELFDGNNSPLDDVGIEFDLDAGQAWVDPVEKVSIGSVFGFYIDSSARAADGGGVFYSDPEHNTGADYGVAHGLLFGVADGGGAGQNATVVAFEDLRIDSTGIPYDGDYNDMVVKVSDTTPVPEPATIAMLGIGGLSLLRRRRGR